MSELAKAQLKVMEEVAYVQKQKLKGLDYLVATEGDIIAALRPAMLKHGITVSPVKVDQLDTRTYETKHGSTMSMIRLAVTYRFTHADSGEFLDTQVVGEAANVSDKGSAAALTMSFKYALLEFFMLERGTDPEAIATHRSDENKKVWDEAYTSLQRCSTEPQINGTMERIRSRTNETGETVLSDDQISELAMYGEQFRLKIRKVAQREQS